MFVFAPTAAVPALTRAQIKASSSFDGNDSYLGWAETEIPCSAADTCTHALGLKVRMWVLANFIFFRFLYHTLYFGFWEISISKNKTRWLISVLNFLLFPPNPPSPQAQQENLCDLFLLLQSLVTRPALMLSALFHGVAGSEVQGSWSGKHWGYLQWSCCTDHSWGTGSCRSQDHRAEQTAPEHPVQQLGDKSVSMAVPVLAGN